MWTERSEETGCETTLGSRYLLLLFYPKPTSIQRTKFDLCVLRQQHVLALDVPVDDFVGVEMRKALRTDKEVKMDH